MNTLAYKDTTGRLKNLIIELLETQGIMQKDYNIEIIRFNPKSTTITFRIKNLSNKTTITKVS